MAEDRNVTVEQQIEGEEHIPVFVERQRWLFFGLPFTFTKYIVKDDTLTIDSGFFTTTEDDCYMYKIQDVQLRTSFLEKIFKLGTIICFTGDKTNPQLHLHHIKHAREIKEYILRQSERARIKRRTVNTLDIGGGPNIPMLDDGCDFE